MKRFWYIIMALMVICFTVMFVFGVKNHYESVIGYTKAQPNYELIYQMEYCRETHQLIVDRPELAEKLNDAGFAGNVSDHQRWVNIYNDVIEELKNGN